MVERFGRQMRGHDRLGHVRSFAGDRNGNVAIFGAIALPVVIGVAALGVELGSGLLAKVENQRVTDLATYSAALAYGETQSQAAMIAAAHNIGRLNGVDPAHMRVRLVAPPNDPGATAVSVLVDTPRTLRLARVLGQWEDLTIHTSAVVEFSSPEEEAAGCVLALSAAESGITLSGGAKLEAKDCVVSSNAAVGVPCGTEIATDTLTYNSAAAPVQPCQGVRNADKTGPARIVRTATPDPFAGSAAIAAATGRFQSVGAMPAAATPQVPAGRNLDFVGGWNQQSQNEVKQQAAAVGCSASWSQPKWTLVCPPRSEPYNFGSITIGGGVSLDFNLDAKATVVNGYVVEASSPRYNFSGSIRNTGAAMNFGPGVYNIAKGLWTGGGTTTAFAAGIYRIGRSDGDQCWGAPGGGLYSICNTGAALTFAGASRFELAGGIANGGGATLGLGEGATNSFRLGPSSTGKAIALGGGSNTYLGDATGPSSLFELVGDIDSGGGGCFVIGAAAEHDIAGNMLISGAVLLGAGTYTVDGHVAFGANGGGSANCNGRTISVYGNDVSLILSGRSTPASGVCKDMAFCVAAGYNNVVLSAPAAGAMARLAVIGPRQASNKAGAAFTQGGASGRVSGAFYFPNGPFSLTGGAGVSGGAGECLQIVASRITLSGGTSGASNCTGAAAVASGPGPMRLVR